MNRMDEAHSLLSSLLQDFTMAYDLDVKWEGQVSGPQTATYLREWLLPGESTGISLGPTAPNAMPLIYQVDIVSSLGGWGPAYEITNWFFSSDYFYRGRVLSWPTNTTRLNLLKGQVGPAFREDTKYVLPMSVTLRAYMSI